MKQTTAAVDERVEIKVIGKSGQISLGKRYAGKTLRLERRQDGTIVLTAVAMVPESQLWTVRNHIAPELSVDSPGRQRRHPSRRKLTIS